MELVARKNELMLLHRALEKRESQFIAVYGRRRVGKTYLVREAYEGRFCFTHTGLYGRSRKEQIGAFTRSLIKTGFPSGTGTPGNWMDAFDLLEKMIEHSHLRQKIIVTFLRRWNISGMPLLPQGRTSFL